MSEWVVTIVHVSVINNGANESLRLIHRNRRSLPTTAPNPGQPGPEKVLILGWATTRLSSSSSEREMIYINLRSK